MADPENLFGPDLRAIRDHIKTVEYFTDVQDVQNAAEAIAGLRPFVPPAAFVCIADESYEPNKVIGGHTQRATSLVSVLFCVPSNRADDEVSDEVEQARKALAAVLKGWTPPGAERAFELVRYRMRMIADGLVWGEWIVRTRFMLGAIAEPDPGP